MGIPIWKPTKRIQRPTSHSPPSLRQQDQPPSTIHHQHSYHQQHNTQNRVQRERRSTLLAEPYYIAADSGYTTPTSTARTNALQQSYPQRRHQTSASSVSSRTRLQNSTTRRLEIERQVELRFFERQELLEQLKITASLLDQFISIRDMSGHGMALPPFITDDLLAILTATSATLISTTQPSTSNSNNHDTARTTRTATTRRPSINYRSLHSYNHDTSMSRLVDRMIEAPPYATRLQELELNIASIHHQVSNQLNRLGASLTLPSPRSILSPPSQFPSLPVNQSLSG